MIDTIEDAMVRLLDVRSLPAERFRYSVYRIIGETIRLLHRHMRRTADIFTNNSMQLHDD